MGVGGHFWDLLKPYARAEGPDFLRDKRVAVDLSFWIVQHDAAVRAHRPGARSPHLRTTFFRTVSLFSKMGAYPVFVVDGEPSPLKAQVRMERFFRGSGLELSELPKTGPGTPAKHRNQNFEKCVRECVELLELLGMPVLRACGEAEGLCAQLNCEGRVDACVTADSDAFLFGAKCVIKCFHSNSNEPFECYNVSDVEAGLGLKRKQMVAIALLVGNDHNLSGVPGFGVDTALRFVQMFSEDEILHRLCEISNGVISVPHCSFIAATDRNEPSMHDGLTSGRVPHCSHCGHPGTKKGHSKSTCEYCTSNGFQNCTEKQPGFKCSCTSCDKDRKDKEQRKYEEWQIRVCKSIAAVENFPNNDVISMYLSKNHGHYDEKDGPLLRWDNPKVDSLVEFLGYHQHWKPSYVRQRMLPMLSTIYLREMASTPKAGVLLYDQYEFHSIQRLKIRYAHPYYLVKWKRTGNCNGNINCQISNEQSMVEEQTGSPEAIGLPDLLNEPDSPQALFEDGFWFLSTDENMELVEAAFPEEVRRFREEKAHKESLAKQRKSNLKCSKSNAGTADSPNSTGSTGIQLSITEFYRSAKGHVQAKPDEVLDNLRSKRIPRETRKVSAAGLDQNLPKSVRRRLLFD